VGRDNPFEQAVTLGHEAFHIVDMASRPNDVMKWFDAGPVHGELRENHFEERARLYENKIRAELIFPFRQISGASPI